MRYPEKIRLDEFRRILNDLAALLGDKEFFFDSSLTVADLALYSQFELLMCGVNPELEPLILANQSLMAWLRRVAAAIPADYRYSYIMPKLTN